MTNAEPTDASGLPDLLMPSEVASLFRVDPKTVTRWAQAGRMPYLRTPGGHCRFPRGPVMALLRQPEQQQDPAPVE